MTDKISEERRVQVYLSYLQSPIWQEVDKPYLEDRFLVKVRKAITMRDSLSDAQLRGLLAEAAEVDHLLNFRQRVVHDFNLTKEQEEARLAEQRTAEEESQHLARYGFRSPFVAGSEAADRNEDET